MCTTTEDQLNWHPGRLDQKTETTLVMRRAYRALDNDPCFRGRSRLVHLEIDDGVVTIEGRVPNQFLKHAVQNVLHRVAGIQRVVNRVHVTPAHGDPG
ncbi:MAG: BON domain-containing protein [Pirellulales bacterium]